MFEQKEKRDRLYFLLNFFADMQIRFYCKTSWGLEKICKTTLQLLCRKQKRHNVHVEYVIAHTTEQVRPGILNHGTIKGE